MFNEISSRLFPDPNNNNNSTSTLNQPVVNNSPSTVDAPQITKTQSVSLALFQTQQLRESYISQLKTWVILQNQSISTPLSPATNPSQSQTVSIEYITQSVQCNLKNMKHQIFADFIINLRRLDPTQMNVDSKELHVELVLNLFAIKILYHSGQGASRSIELDPALCQVLEAEDLTKFFSMLAQFPTYAEELIALNSSKWFSKLNPCFPFPSILHVKDASRLTNEHLEQLKQTQFYLQRTNLLGLPQLENFTLRCPLTSGNVIDQEFKINRTIAKQEFKFDLADIEILDLNFNAEAVDLFVKILYDYWPSYEALPSVIALLMQVSTHRGDKWLHEALKAKTKQPNSSRISILAELADYLKHAREIQNGSVEKMIESSVRDLIMPCLTNISHPESMHILNAYGPLLTYFKGTLRDDWVMKFKQFFPNVKHLEILDHHSSDQIEYCLPSIETLTFHESSFCSFDKLEKNAQHLEKLEFVGKEVTLSVLNTFEDPQNLSHLKEILFQNASFFPNVLEKFKFLPGLEKLELTHCVIYSLSDLEKALALCPSLKHLVLYDSKFMISLPSKLHAIQYFLEAYKRCSSPINSIIAQRLKKAFPHITITIPTPLDTIQKNWQIDQTDFAQVVGISDPLLHPSTPYTLAFNQAPPTLNDLDQLISVLDQQIPQLFTTDESLAWLNKMRYNNILPYDQNNLTASLGGFVFNGSPIRGPDGKKRIATQGPTPETIGDFWQAVLTLNTKLIIMTTNCQEMGRLKCSQYWPPKPAQPMEARNDKNEKLSITLLSEQTIDSELGIQERQLEIKNSIANQTHLVTQLHVTKWSDQTALDGKMLFRLVAFVKSYEAKLDPNESIINHCSAGVGRTGTLLFSNFLDHEIRRDLPKTRDEESNQLRPENLYFNLENGLLALKQQRMGMVQTAEQALSIVEFFNHTIEQLLKAENNLQ